MIHDMIPQKMILALILLLCVIISSVAGDDLQVLLPKIEQNGRFWIYRNGPNKPSMPFRPYGWMSDKSPSKAISLNLECNVNPHIDPTENDPSENQMCMHVSINWDSCLWASVACISGPDKPAWWGETTQGWYYDLRQLKKKKLAFFARGEKGEEIINVRIGLLENKKYGDSLTNPLTKAIRLTKNWKYYEISLTTAPIEELKRICTGFEILSEWEKQNDKSSKMEFYIDDVYME